MSSYTRLACGIASALFACSSGTKFIAPCDRADPPIECTAPCDPTPGALNTCAAGFFCGPDGTCTQQCAPGSTECGVGFVCTDEGRCIDDGTPPPDAGPDADCPDVHFQGERLIPTIELLIDQSSSMNQAFGNTTRWQAVVTALVGAGGIVQETEADIVYGATLYSAPGGTCPALVKQARALNNYAAMQTFLTTNVPRSGTPTGEAVQATAEDFVANPPAAGSPPFIVLATDGQPNGCINHPSPEAFSVGQVQAAYAAGIGTFVLSVGPDVALSHLQQLANAGAGQDPVSGTATYFVATDPTALVAAFDQIIGGVVSCEFDINGNIDVAQASSGTVTLNGTPLTFGADWVLLDQNTISLIGAACDTLKSTSQPTVNAQFPCEAIIE